MRTKFDRFKFTPLKVQPSPTKEQIRKLLRDYAIKIWQAARMCGVCDRTLSGYLSGKHPMPAARWAQLCKLVKITVHPDREIEL